MYHCAKIASNQGQLWALDKPTWRWSRALKFTYASTRGQDLSMQCLTLQKVQLFYKRHPHWMSHELFFPKTFLNFATLGPPCLLNFLKISNHGLKLWVILINFVTSVFPFSNLCHTTLPYRFGHFCAFFPISPEIDNDFYSHTAASTAPVRLVKSNFSKFHQIQNDLKSILTNFHQQILKNKKVLLYK